MKQPIETQALIIGAGPAGLFAAFELGLMGISAHIVDALPYAGGQCIELYPDKPIYDIPGTPATTGRQLVASLLEQIKPFNTPLHLGQQVSAIEKQHDSGFKVSTTQGQSFITKTIFIAAGVGAFLPKKLSVAGLDAFEGRQIFYHVSQLPKDANQRITIVGSEDAAVQAAIDLSQHHTVTLLHRRDVFNAAPDSLSAMRDLVASGKLNLSIGQIAGFETDNAKLSALQITDVNGVTAPLPTNTLLVLQGLSPKLGTVADWGLALDRKQLQVDTEKFQTSEVGILAVGDINTYPGKRKLIVSGFHEATLAAFAAAEIVFPNTPTQLLYTTTSTLLLKRLGRSVE
ncbi:MAG: NAD(P)/FAD-dependent oxidoreductase [Polaromonas sp.]|jgi:thioredoxin reductase (NADPH)|nr:NAD(P)/FAD-dependent oxidoreductase [Polaromonas sp.]MBP9830872.1 NAD(P)/FAD-dependent oxidoreductase [Polaromonas sp.]